MSPIVPKCLVINIIKCGTKTKTSLQLKQIILLSQFRDYGWKRKFGKSQKFLPAKLKYDNSVTSTQWKLSLKKFYEANFEIFPNIFNVYFGKSQRNWYKGKNNNISYLNLHLNVKFLNSSLRKIYFSFLIYIQKWVGQRSFIIWSLYGCRKVGIQLPTKPNNQFSFTLVFSKSPVPR